VNGTTFRLEPVLARSTLMACALCVAACSGARHRKVNGPPPEYEPPEDPAALDANDAGTVPSPVQAADGGAPAEPTRS
jgi:hypothetical protein